MKNTLGTAVPKLVGALAWVGSVCVFVSLSLAPARAADDDESTLTAEERTLKGAEALANIMYLCSSARSVNGKPKLEFDEGDKKVLVSGISGLALDAQEWAAQLSASGNPVSAQRLAIDVLADALLRKRSEYPQINTGNLKIVLGIITRAALKEYDYRAYKARSSNRLRKFVVAVVAAAPGTAAILAMTHGFSDSSLFIRAPVVAVGVAATAVLGYFAAQTFKEYNELYREEALPLALAQEMQAMADGAKCVELWRN